MPREILKESLKDFQPVVRTYQQRCMTTGTQPRLQHPNPRISSCSRQWNDGASWKAFFETYWKLIYSTAIQTGLSSAEAEDVVRETIISVGEEFPEFQRDPHGEPFKCWLLRITRWRIIDQVRKRSRAGVPLERETTGLLITALADSDDSFIEGIWERHWKENLLDAALNRVKRKVKPKHFQIYHLALHSWPARRIASALGVSPGFVCLVKHRVGDLLKKEVGHLENHRW